MRDMMDMMKQAKQLQSRMQEVQERIAALEVTGAAGGGLVSVTLTGRGDMRRLRIDPSLLVPDEAEIVEDLIIAAHNDARGKLETRTAEMAQDLTGGMSLPPGLKLPF